jgi:pyrroloquinoline quinone biosynthesis protein D
MPLTAASVPALWRFARLQFDEVRQQHVLLYPEGSLLLNDTGAAILRLCDGQRSVSDIAAELGAQYGNADLTPDVLEYLDRLAERELVRAG